VTADSGETPAADSGAGSVSNGSKTPPDETATTNPTRITISIREVPADKIRDVLKVTVHVGVVQMVDLLGSAIDDDVELTNERYLLRFRREVLETEPGDVNVFTH
jgi:hypothetical protein